jgi:hypothetical protein
MRCRIHTNTSCLIGPEVRELTTPSAGCGVSAIQKRYLSCEQVQAETTDDDRAHGL